MSRWESSHYLGIKTELVTTSEKTCFYMLKNCKKDRETSWRGNAFAVTPTRPSSSPPPTPGETLHIGLPTQAGVRLQAAETAFFAFIPECNVARGIKEKFPSSRHAVISQLYQSEGVLFSFGVTVTDTN